MRRVLALVAAAVSSMVALAFVIPLAWALHHVAYDRALHDAERQATALTVALQGATDGPSIERAMAKLPAGRDGRLGVHVLDRSKLDRGKLVGYGARRAGAQDVRLAARQGTTRSVSDQNGDLVLQPVKLSGNRTGVVEVAVRRSELFHGVAVAWTVVGLMAVVLVAGSVALAGWLAGRLVQATEVLAGAARQLGTGDLGVRIRPGGPAELAEAGVAFNVMADRVVELLASERELVADLSHRLRTPLTALRLDAEAVGASPAAQRVRDAAWQLEQEIDAIIRLARSPLTGGLDDSCDAAEVIRSRMGFWSALAADQGRQCEMIGTDRPVRVPLARAELTAVVDALVGNVFRYTPVGCSFSVALREVDGSPCLIVEDAGPGIADSAAALRRGASTGGSTGLGLDIARRAAEGSGGAVRISRGTLGGARVWLRFGGVHPSAYRAELLPARRWLRRTSPPVLAPPSRPGDDRLR